LLKEYLSPVTDVTIQQLRNYLGIKTSVAADTKRIINDLYKSSGCVYDIPGTTTGLQCLSESWAVARLVNRMQSLLEIRALDPELIDKTRNMIMNNRKIFDVTRLSQGKKTSEDLSSVINDILEQEVDKALVRRFNL
jgi:hypothetical protein